MGKKRTQKKEKEEEVVESSEEERSMVSDSSSEEDDSEVEFGDDLKKELSASLRFQSDLKGEESEESEEEEDSDNSDSSGEEDSDEEEEEEDSEDEDEAFFSKKMKQVEKSKKRKRKEEEEAAPVWVDEDDHTEEKWDVSNKKIKKVRMPGESRNITADTYGERVRERYSNMQRADVSWAARPEKKRARKDEDEDEEEEDDDDDLLRTTGALLEQGGTKKKGLESGRISLVRVANGNASQPSHAVISALEFHPNQQIMLTAGQDKTLNLFHIDGQRNPKVQGLYIKDMPITSAFFCKHGTEVVMTGKRPFFYFFDLESGKADRIGSIRGRNEKDLRYTIISPDNKYIAAQGLDGAILVLCAVSKQLLFTLQINALRVNSMAFSHDSTFLFATGGGGEVYEWDLRRRRCRERWTDEGSSAVTAITASQNYLACGSSAGVVNLYKGPRAKGIKVGATREPTKTFMNLRTEISGCAFNREEEIMAFWSMEKMNAVRLVHLPTQTVFSNFPAPVPPLGHPSKCTFSPNSGYFAMGNDYGRVLLYRVPHYGKA